MGADEIRGYLLQELLNQIQLKQQLKASTKRRDALLAQLALLENQEPEQSTDGEDGGKLPDSPPGDSDAPES